MDSEKMRTFIREQRKRVENSKLPLKDIRVIDLGAVVAAPYAATMLGDFGAEVVKIEPRDVPDAIRFWSVVEGKYQPYWLVNSRNKLPITLNLKHPKGQKILRQLVERADVLVENMRPGTLDRLGFPAKGALEDQQRVGDRAHLGLRADRPLCGEARFRHPGRIDERVCPPEYSSRTATHQPPSSAGGYVDRDASGLGDHGGPAHAKARG